MLASVFDVHFDELDAAEAFLEAVREQGFDAELSVDVFAGEDDLDDAASIVHVRADQQQVHALVEDHGGWMSAPVSNPDAAPHVPVELPSGPIHFKN